jgi:hypothetical protein
MPALTPMMGSSCLHAFDILSGRITPSIEFCHHPSHAARISTTWESKNTSSSHTGLPRSTSNTVRTNDAVSRNKRSDLKHFYLRMALTATDIIIIRQIADDGGRTEIYGYLMRKSDGTCRPPFLSNITRSSSSLTGARNMASIMWSRKSSCLVRYVCS